MRRLDIQPEPVRVRVPALRLAVRGQAGRSRRPKLQVRPSPLRVRVPALRLAVRGQAGRSR